MELSQLQSFLQVAEQESVSRAAEALFLSQPAVTKHVRSLERELGVALLDRTGRGVRLTEAGEALRGYAARTLALLDECRHVIADLEAGAAGRLSLGAGVTTSIFHLPAWLDEFQARYPQIDVAVRTGRSREVIALVLGREVDLGFITSPVSHPDLRLVELFQEEIRLVAPASHPLARREATGEELSRAPLILFSQGTGFRRYVDHALQDAGIRANVKMQSDSVEAIKSFVEVGLGLSFLPAASVEAEIRAGTLAAVRVRELPPLHRSTSVLFRGDRYLTAGMRGFLQILDKRFAPGARSADGGDPSRCSGTTPRRQDLPIETQAQEGHHPE